MRLHLFILQRYAPGHSRFNPIERSWSLLTKLLVRVILPTEINSNLVDENTDDWLKILDQAATLCGKFWDGKTYEDLR